MRSRTENIVFQGVESFLVHFLNMHNFTGLLAENLGHLSCTKELGSDAHVIVQPCLWIEKCSKNKGTFKARTISGVQILEPSQLTRLGDRINSERRVRDKGRRKIIRPIIPLPEHEHISKVLHVERGVEPSKKVNQNKAASAIEKSWKYLRSPPNTTLLEILVHTILALPVSSFIWRAVER
jgi:hypothetical protein